MLPFAGASPSMRTTIAVTALGCTLFLSACGIKGPLFLPPSHPSATPPPVSQPAASQPAAASSDKDKASTSTPLDTPPPPAHD
jgi:predicted small lipoprotein YifL